MKTKMIIEIVVALLLTLAWVSIPAFASDDDCRNGHDQCGHDDRGGGDQEQRQGQGQEQGQGQHQGQEQTALGGAASAVNDGNELSVNTVYEAQAPDVVLIPNNNTERCLRVFGLSFSNQSGGGGIGIPWRSAKCDFEQAADDAFAQGEREIGWFWKCKNKNLYKDFGEGAAGQAACLHRMVGELTKTRTINTLEEQLTEVLELRESELVQYKESKARLTEMCNDSKNRILEACQK